MMNKCGKALKPLSTVPGIKQILKNKTTTVAVGALSVG